MMLLFTSKLPRIAWNFCTFEAKPTKSDNTSNNHLKIIIKGNMLAKKAVNMLMGDHVTTNQSLFSPFKINRNI